MKSLLLLLALSTQTYSQELLTVNCTHTQFSDIEEISISISNEDVTMTEKNPKGFENKVIVSIEDAEMNGISLTEWNGYTRTLHYSDEEWTIRTSDECTSHSNTIACE